VFFFFFLFQPEMYCLLKLKQENKFQKTKTILQERWNKKKEKKN